MMLNRTKRFFRKLRNKDSREAFVSARVAAAVGTQIAALRQKNKWSQEELAQRAKMKQPRIALLERGDYESFSFGTLKRLAAAFGVAVRIDFLSFPDFLKWSEGFTSEVVTPDSFDESARALEFEETKATLGWEQKSPNELRDQGIAPTNLETENAALSFPNLVRVVNGQMVAPQNPLLINTGSSLIPMDSVVNTGMGGLPGSQVSTAGIYLIADDGSTKGINQFVVPHGVLPSPPHLQSLQNLLYGLKDAELAAACLQVYNDFVAQYAQAYKQQEHRI